MVEQPVPDFGFVNMATLRIVDIKTIISAVFVSFVDQIIVQFGNIIKQIKSKRLRIVLVGFADNKFLPRRKQVI